MATLVGSTSEGATADFIANGNIAAWEFTAGATGHIGRIGCQTKAPNTALTAVEMGIYSDSAGNPNVLLGKASVDSITEARGTGVFYATLAAVIAVSSGTVYHLAIGASGETFDWNGTAVAGIYVETGASGILPSTWTGGTAGGNRIAIWGEDAAPIMPRSELDTSSPLGPF